MFLYDGDNINPEFKYEPIKSVVFTNNYNNNFSFELNDHIKNYQKRIYKDKGYFKYLRLFNDNKFVNIGNFFYNIIFDNNITLNEEQKIIIDSKINKENSILFKIIFKFYCKKEFIDYKFLLKIKELIKNINN